MELIEKLFACKSLDSKDVLNDVKFVGKIGSLADIRLVVDDVYNRGIDELREQYRHCPEIFESFEQLTPDNYEGYNVLCELKKHRDDIMILIDKYHPSKLVKGGIYGWMARVKSTAKIHGFRNSKNVLINKYDNSLQLTNYYNTPSITNNLTNPQPQPYHTSITTTTISHSLSTFPINNQPPTIYPHSYVNNINEIDVTEDPTVSSDKSDSENKHAFLFPSIGCMQSEMKTPEINPECYRLMSKVYTQSGIKDYLKKTLKLSPKSIDFALILCHLIHKKHEDYTPLMSTMIQDIAQQLKIEKYSSIVDLLKKHEIIELDAKKPYGTGGYSKGDHCRAYRIGDTYCHKKLKMSKLIRSIKITTQQNPDDLINPICSHLRSTYSHLSLPTIDEIEARARVLYADRETFKGKDCVYLKISKTKIADYQIIKKDKRGNEYVGLTHRILDYDIDLYEKFLSDGIQDPYSTSCGRVCDSFVFMRKWERKEIKIDGEAIAEVDLSFLHGAIIWTFTNDHVTKQESDAWLSLLSTDLYTTIATYVYPKTNDTEQVKENRQKIKTEILSYFNDSPKNQKHYKCHQYFIDNHASIMGRVIAMKTLTDKLHAETSNVLLDYESRLLGVIMQKLSKLGIHCLYAFDALYPTASNADKVKEIMDYTALSMGIPTHAKIE